MSWYILVVLQTSALYYGGSSSSNWDVLGEFRGEQACLQAARKLKDEQASVRKGFMPEKFVCLPKETR